MLAHKWNDNWLFWKRNDSFVMNPGAPSDAKSVSLPHDAMLMEAPYAESRNGGNTGYRDGGVYVYQKKLPLKESDTGRTCFLKLEGVYMNAMVYVNGELAAHRPNGYTVFLVPLHPHLKPGQENEIRVEVRNSAMPNSRWYSGSGIYRDVYLLNADGIYLVPDSLQAETKVVQDGNAYVELRVRVHNRTMDNRRVSVRLEVIDACGAVVASDELPLPAASGGEELLRDTVVIPNAKLWSDETPELYQARVTLLDGGQMLDQCVERIGIRTLLLDAKHGLRVNGRPVKLRGACLHHDNGVLGAAAYAEAEYRRVYLLKEAGFNAIRSAHNPISPAMLRACDALGVYVMDEAFDMWTRCKGDNDYALYFDQWWERDVEAMVTKDYNHPSVILYSMGNEIPEVCTDQGTALLRAMSEKVKTLDAGRYTTVAINGIFTVAEKMGLIIRDIVSQMPPEKSAELMAGGNVNLFMTVMHNYTDEIARHPIMSSNLALAAPAVDAMGYNYMTGRYQLDREQNPNRVVIGSETYPPEIGRNWEEIKECPNVIGDFTWTGWDYIGEAGIGVPAYRLGEGGIGAQFPCQLAYCGDLDITGFRRPASYYREIVFGLRKAPYITVQNPWHYGKKLNKTEWIISDSISSWTWPGLEGKPAIVEVYCAAAEVELLQDGISLGRRRTGSACNFTACFDTAYRPGTLTAIAWDGDRELGRMELVTAGEAVPRVIPEPLVEAGDTGLRFYQIQMADESGNVNTAVDCEIRINVQGGTLLGFGSADPKPGHLYQEPVTRTWYGRALAVVRAEGEPKVTVNVV